MREGLLWNVKWLEKAVFVFKDPRTHLRLKLSAACDPDVRDPMDVLNLAWRYCYPFHLFIPATDVPEFCERTVSDVNTLTIPAMYEPGFLEHFISWGNGGPALKAAWLNSAKEVLNRPEAVAFISEGGILSCLAQVLDPDLIFRFVQGPSLQVTQYAQGESFLEKTLRPGERTRFFTTDRVSFGEKLILVGHIPGGSSSSDTSLFPMPDVFEEESNHYRGMVGQCALNIIDNLFKDLDRGIIKART
ncbi:hypothetical protein C8R44DRAFT_605783 [Mycena epipterygia]|nr:hypothetical protein C8R44DRAFT_605783 [Mycena epipterygia]